jgi:hypothetical protein
MALTTVLEKLRAMRQASDAFYDALDEHLTGQIQRVATAGQVAPRSAQVPTTIESGRARMAKAAPSLRAVHPLPPPPTAAPRPDTLSDETRAANLEPATAIAKRVAIAVNGTTSPMFREGLKGQLALEGVPFDEQLLNDATAAAARG